MKLGTTLTTIEREITEEFNESIFADPGHYAIKARLLKIFSPTLYKIVKNDIFYTVFEDINNPGCTFLCNDDDKIIVPYDVPDLENKPHPPFEVLKYVHKLNDKQAVEKIKSLGYGIKICFWKPITKSGKPS
ncbi:MAG: hypothetical protein WCT77_07110, partial [Bacteroidota bacterium]